MPGEQLSALAAAEDYDIELLNPRHNYSAVAKSGPPPAD